MLRGMAVETDDAQLMLRYRDGGVPAFETLYARHKGRLFRFFLRQTGDSTAAEALYPAVWKKLIQARTSYEPRRSFSIFVYQIAHQGLADYYRSLDRELGDGDGHGHAEAAGAPDPADSGDGFADEVRDPAFESSRWSLVDWEDKPEDAAPVLLPDETAPRPPPHPAAKVAPLSRPQRFQAALAMLAPGPREAFLLHEEAGLGLAEIAAATGMSPDRAKSRLRNAVQSLLKALEEPGALIAGDDGQLDALLARRSTLTRDYAGLESMEPSPKLNGGILTEARSTVPSTRKRQSVKTTPAADGTRPAAPVTPARLAPRPAPVVEDDDEDEDDPPPPTARPRWLVPAVAAGIAVLLIGVGAFLLGGEEEAAETAVAVKRDRPAAVDRKRPDAGEEVAGDDLADGDVAVEALDVPVETASSGPAPFDLDGPPVDDLDRAISLIRRDLIMASADATSPDAGTAQVEAEVEEGLIQPRERRLAKILELYDGGNVDLAGDALDIFLRDFEDDPISQRILGAELPVQ